MGARGMRRVVLERGVSLDNVLLSCLLFLSWVVCSKERKDLLGGERLSRPKWVAIVTNSHLKLRVFIFPALHLTVICVNEDTSASLVYLS